VLCCHVDVLCRAALCPQVGDWGREGKHNQSEVAELMGGVAADQPSQFIVSTGGWEGRVAMSRRERL
jgi:hypothetical protein